MSSDDTANLSQRYPELQRFDSPAEAARVLRAGQKQLLKMPRFWVAVVLYALAIGVVCGALLMNVRRWIQVPPSLVGGLVGGLIGGTGLMAVTWMWRSRIRRFLRQELVARGIPICVGCGYDLRGLTESRCPECGADF